ncbi:hypothetical protein BDW62DRAFT_175029 [Aspergillus aurantiobrunneus]
MGSRSDLGISMTCDRIGALLVSIIESALLVLSGIYEVQERGYRRTSDRKCQRQTAEGNPVVHRKTKWYWYGQGYRYG